MVYHSFALSATGCPCGLNWGERTMWTATDSIDCLIIFLSIKICLVVPLLHLNAACSFLIMNPLNPFDHNFPHHLADDWTECDSTPVFTSFQITSFLSSLAINPFLHFPSVLSSLHAMSMISLTFIVSGKVNDSFEQLCSYILSIQGAFLFLRCFVASFISDLSISSFSSAASILTMLTGLLGFSLYLIEVFIPPLNLVFLSLSLRLVLYCGTVRWSLVTQTILKSGNSVSMCCCQVAFSDSFARSSVHLRLSILTCLLVSVFLSVFICPSDLAPTPTWLLSEIIDDR